MTYKVGVALLKSRLDLVTHLRARAAEIDDSGLNEKLDDLDDEMEELDSSIGEASAMLDELEDGEDDKSEEADSDEEDDEISF